MGTITTKHFCTANCLDIYVAFTSWVLVRGSAYPRKDCNDSNDDDTGDDEPGGLPEGLQELGGEVVPIPCDQMSILFFQYLPICHIENAPKNIENFQIEFNILPNNK